MINEITLTADQAKPFKTQMVKNICFDARHRKSVDLNAEPIKGYPHDGGWPVVGLQGLWWLYITCPKCGYEWAIWKLGVSRSYDPTAEAEYKRKKAVAEAAFEALKCEKCGHSLANHGTEGNTKGVCLVPGCRCGYEQLDAYKRMSEGQEHDATEDLPRSEEDRADYLPGSEELPE